MTIVAKLYEQFEEVKKFLEAQGEISMASSIENSFRKALLLAAASFFEAQVKDCLVDIATERKIPILFLEFMKNKAIERQYHTYFSWNQRNANSFFSLFGDDFKEAMVKEVRGDDAMRESITAFMELGELRNQLVHQNFAVFPLEKTSQEIFTLYQTAERFVADLPAKLRAWTQVQPS